MITNPRSSAIPNVRELHTLIANHNSSMPGNLGDHEATTARTPSARLLQALGAPLARARVVSEVMREIELKRCESVRCECDGLEIPVEIDPTCGRTLVLKLTAV